MLSQSRSTKVLTAGLVSIGILAILLKTLGTNPNPAGAFSLSQYYHLTPIENVVSSNSAPTNPNWNSIEITYTNTKPIVINKLSAQSDQDNYDILNYHFIVWNGLIGGNGQIQATEKWQKQSPTTQDQTYVAGRQTIHIGVIADNKVTYPTDFQIKRAEALVEALSRKFDIQAESICYPENM